MPFQTNSTHRGVGIKQWRLIVRNLNFKTKEEDILQWAKQYGKIVEVRLPKCKDKRYPDSCAGFCFIQFAKRADAEKARNELNFSQLVERKVAIDWAVDKDSWVTVEQEAKNHLDIVKKLNEDSKKSSRRFVRKEVKITKAATKKEPPKEVKSEGNRQDNNIMDTDSNLSNGEVNEQKEAKNNNLDKNKSGAIIKDKRNLYLLRASILRADNAQSNGMSNDDAKLRQRLIQLARNKLKNLVMFVSPTRLVIHNIPYSLTDHQLLDICQATQQQQQAKNSITECRIMREIEGENEKGKPILGRSKGFGFVNFRTHPSALECLRQMNNNPQIFTNERRPIVEFSIENLNALRTKERRLKMSRGEEVDNNYNRSKEKYDIEKKYKCSEEPEAVERTKRELMAGGRKWMPKKLGRKIRHKERSHNSKKAEKRQQLEK